MNKGSYIILILLLNSFVCCSQVNSKIQLIVRGDDMGFSHSGNEAIIKCFKEGIETSIEVIVPSPWFPEAVKLLIENPTVDVGIHIALTSEWDNMKYRPVSHCSSLTDDSGYFFPFIWPNKNYPGRALLESNWKIEEIEKEFRAQIELALKKIPRISHISAHMGCYDMSPEVKALAKKLAIEYGIDIDPIELGVIDIGYQGSSKTTEDKKRSFIAMLERLEPGKTHLFVDHPGLDTPELRGIHHKGYENVALDRQGVTDVWTDPDVKEVIRKRDIRLISYREIKRK
ncbi:MAG TPA: polysaccharide deacetylase family protein [Chryseolinea sp.]